MQTAPVRSLVRELGSYMPCSTVRKEKKTKVAALGNYWMVTKSKKEKRATEDKMAG